MQHDENKVYEKLSSMWWGRWKVLDIDKLGDNSPPKFT